VSSPMAAREWASRHYRRSLVMPTASKVSQHVDID
jgi:hypothetical protein